MNTGKLSTKPEYEKKLRYKFGIKIECNKYVNTYTAVKHWCMYKGTKHTFVCTPRSLLHDRRAYLPFQDYHDINRLKRMESIEDYENRLLIRFKIKIIVLDRDKYKGTGVGVTPKLKHMDVENMIEFLDSPANLLHERDLFPSKKHFLLHKQRDFDNYQDLNNKITFIDKTYVSCFYRYRFTCNKCSKPGDMRFDQVKNLVGCSRCNNVSRYSNISMVFFEQLRKAIRGHRLHIQHAESKSGEKRIKVAGKTLRIDFYIKKHGLAIEFYGDAFHGNSKVFTPRKKCHPFNNKTAARLYKETIERERALRKLGYKVIGVWEKDFNKNPEKTIQKVVSKLEAICF